MTNDLDDRVAELRPTGEDTAQRFSLVRRQAVLADIGRQPTERVRFRPSRWAIGSVAASLAVSGLLAGLFLPTGAPGGPDTAAAATLRHLAVLAGRQVDEVGPHQFAYVSTLSEWRLVPGEDPWPTTRRVGAFAQQRREVWTSRQGDSWLVASPTSTRCIAHRALVSSPSGVNAYQQQDASFLDGLPTTAAGLRAYIDAHPSGENHGAKNLFMSVGDLLRTGLASSTLRAAALNVLAETDGLRVDAHTQDALGRPAIRVDLNGSSLFFDPTSARVLEEQDTNDGSVAYREIVEHSATVDAHPSNLPTC